MNIFAKVSPPAFIFHVSELFFSDSSRSVSSKGCFSLYLPILDQSLWHILVFLNKKWSKPLDWMIIFLRLIHLMETFNNSLEKSFSSFWVSVVMTVSRCVNSYSVHTSYLQISTKLIWFRYLHVEIWRWWSQMALLGVFFGRLRMVNLKL